MGTRLGRWGGAGILGMALVGGAISTRAEDAGKPVEAKAAFDALKGLVGTWTIEEAPVADASTTIVYKVVGNGSAVVEDMFPGSDHSMVTVYHLDGDELVMTHYCAAGNQPRMKLDRAESTATHLKFGFNGGTNFDPVKDMHMHEGHFDLLEDGRVKAAWTAYSGGKPAGTHEFTLTRAK